MSVQRGGVKGPGWTLVAAAVIALVASVAVIGAFAFHFPLSGQSVNYLNPGPEGVDAGVQGFQAGTYALAFGPLPGYTKPKNGTVDLKGGTLTAINATYAKGQSAQGSSSTTTASPEQSSTTTQSKPTMTSTTIACTGDSYMVGSTCVTKTATTSQSSLNLFICPGQSFANRLCAYLTVTSVTQSRFGNTANTGDLISVTGEVCPVPTASSMGYACEPVSLTGRTGAGGQVQIPVIAEDTEGPAYFAGNLSVSDVTLQSGHQTVDWPMQTSARVYYVAYFSGQVLGLSLFGGLQSALGIMGTIFLGAFIAIVGAATIAAAADLPSSEPQARAPRRQRREGR